MLNKLSKDINTANRKKGFYEENDALLSLVASRNPELLPALQQTIFAQRIALIISEASEALEANRKGHEMQMVTEFQRNSVVPDMNDEQFVEWFSKNVKDTQEDEIADTIIRCLDKCGEYDIDIEFHITQKLRFNALRPYKHGKKY